MGKKTDLSKYMTDKKKKKSQIPIALLLTIVVVAFGIYLGDIQLILFWTFGIIIGWVLQRARFCFTAAFRDPIITGDTKLLRAVLLSIGLTTIGFAALSLHSISKGGTAMGLDSVVPTSILTIVGGIFFGIGMVIAGGCATGTLFRIGEGFLLQIVVFFFFMIGSAIGSGFMGHLEPIFSNTASAIHLPQYLGWIGALVFQFVLLALFYTIALRWERKKLYKNGGKK